MGRIRRGTTDIEVNLNNRHLTCIEDDIFQETLTPNKILRRDTISIWTHEVTSEDESKMLRNRSSRPVGLRPTTLLKKRFWHKCFPVNFVKFLRTPFSTEHLWWLLLEKATETWKETQRSNKETISLWKCGSL